MQYTNQQIADQIAKIIEKARGTTQSSSFANGTMTYDGKEYTIPSTNSLKRKTYLNNR